jgi:hypothetical protein
MWLELHSCGYVEDHCDVNKLCIYLAEVWAQKAKPTPWFTQSCLVSCGTGRLHSTSTSTSTRVGALAASPRERHSSVGEGAGCSKLCSHRRNTPRVFEPSHHNTALRHKTSFVYPLRFHHLTISSRIVSAQVRVVTSACVITPNLAS